MTRKSPERSGDKVTTIIINDGADCTHRLQAQEGLSIMEILRPLRMGIQGECEGSMTCATCHVKVEATWYGRLAPPSDAEADMLDCIFNAGPTSRLGCQILVEPALDGIELSVPPR